MQKDLNLPPHFLTEFDRTAFQSPADCLETSSNLCLYFLRTAIGSTYQLTNQPNDRISIQLVAKTQSEAFRVFAGFVAFTLWLPITFVGIVLWAYSESHAAVYRALQTIQQTIDNGRLFAQLLPLQPPPTTTVTQSTSTPVSSTATESLPLSVPPVVTATSSAASVSQSSPSLPLTDAKQKAQEEVVQTPSTEVLNSDLKALVKLAQSAEKRAQWDSEKSVKLILDVLKRLESMPWEHEKNIPNPLLINLKILFDGILSEDELMQCLPAIMRHPRARLFVDGYDPTHRNEGWLTSARCLIYGNQLIERIKAGENGLWDVWSKLYHLRNILLSKQEATDRLGKSGWDGIGIGKQSVQDKQKMLRDTLKALGENTPLLGQLYLAVNESNLLVTLLSEEQLVVLTTQLKQMRRVETAVIAGLLKSIMSGDTTDLKANLARIAAVPRALGVEDILQWCNTLVGQRIDSRVVVSLLVSYILQTLERPLQNGIDPTQDRTNRVNAIVAAFKQWYITIEECAKSKQNYSIGYEPRQPVKVADGLLMWANAGDFASLLIPYTKPENVPLLFEALLQVKGQIEPQHRKAYARFNWLLVREKALKMIQEKTSAKLRAQRRGKLLKEVELKIVDQSALVIKTSPAFLHRVLRDLMEETLKLKTVSDDIVRTSFKAFISQVRDCGSSRCGHSLPCILNVVDHIKKMEHLDAAIDAAITAIVPMGKRGNLTLNAIMDAAVLNNKVRGGENTLVPRAGVTAKIAERRKLIADQITPIIKDATGLLGDLIPTILDYYFALPPVTPLATK